MPHLFFSRRARHALAFFSKKVSFDPSLGNLRLKPIFLERTRADPFDKHSSPITINKMPCNTGKNKPIIPSKTKAPPAMSHLIRVIFANELKLIYSPLFFLV